MPVGGYIFKFHGSSWRDLEKDVLGFEVAVHHIFAVTVLESLGHLNDEVLDLSFGELLAWLFVLQLV